MIVDRVLVSAFSDAFSDNNRAFAMKIAEVQVPRTIHEALNQSDWRKAVFYEMSALEKTSTWEIVDLLKDKNTVGWEELKG